MLENRAFIELLKLNFDQSSLLFFFQTVKKSYIYKVEILKFNSDI